MRRLLAQRYDASVLRRTAILFSLGLPGFVAILLLHYSAAALLSAQSFGLFYVATTAVAVLFSGSLVLNLHFTRFLVGVTATADRPVLFAALRHIERLVILWGGACAAVVFALLLGIGQEFGVQSRVIILLIVLDTYTAYVADLGRVLLQTLRRTVSLGLYTSIWMTLRLALCVICMLAFGTVWGVLLGSVAAAVIVFATFRSWTARAMGDGRPTVPALPSLVSLVPLALGYGLLIALSNLDVLLGYFLLGPEDLAHYSASSVLPKAILVVTTPVLQMLFALMVGSRPSDRDARLVARKSEIVVFLLAAGGMLAIWLSSGWVCGGAWGLKLCKRPTMNLLLLSVVPLSLLRVSVLLQFARRRDWRALWLVAPMLAFAANARMAPRLPDALAQEFAVWSVAALVLVAGLSFLVDRRRQGGNVSRTSGA
jgi:hypothetical protein